MVQISRIISGGSNWKRSISAAPGTHRNGLLETSSRRGKSRTHILEGLATNYQYKYKLGL